MVSADGSAVVVKSKTRHSSLDREMVMLETVSFNIPLTYNHRVIILRGGSHQTIPAGHLRVGDSVQTGSGEEKWENFTDFFRSINLLAEFQ